MLLELTLRVKLDRERISPVRFAVYRRRVMVRVESGDKIDGGYKYSEAGLYAAG